MNRFRLFLGLVITTTFALSAHAARQQPTRPGSTESAICQYKGYIVLDAATGNAILQDNPEVISPPASMTKLMTYAVLWDKIQHGDITLDTQVKIDASDAKMGGTQVYLDERETFSVEELIYAMMIQSANDAAHALARISTGSVPLFVEQMNAKAKELGMTRTIFRTPHGLPPPSRKISEGDLTTPHDFALLCRYLVLKTDVLKYTSVRERDFGPNRPKGPMRMDNHNKLIGRVVGVDGLKTGYTEAAGYCLSATAERNGRRVVAVIMGCFGPNGEKDFGHSRDQKMIELLEHGFAAATPLASTGAVNTMPPGNPTRPNAAALTPKTPAPASAPAAKPTVTAKPVPVAQSPAPTPAATPAPVAQPDAGPISPISPVSTDSSPVSDPNTGDTSSAPAVKFELPKKK